MVLFICYDLDHTHYIGYSVLEPVIVIVFSHGMDYLQKPITIMKPKTKEKSVTKLVSEISNSNIRTLGISS